MSTSLQIATSKKSRKFQRFPTDIAATVAFDRKLFNVRIKDISRLGCCVSVNTPVSKGDEIIVRVRGLSIVATIVWVAAPLMGANFRKEINPLQVVRDNCDHPMFAGRRRADSMINLASPVPAARAR